MPKKITEAATQNFVFGRPWCQGNTCVTVDPEAGTTVLSLHGHAIAKIVPGDAYPHSPELYIRSAGWWTNTTKERLNGLPGVHAYTDRKVPHLNGQPWPNHENWTRVEGF